MKANKGRCIAMKKEFSTRPESISEQHLKNCYTSWYNCVTGIPHLIFLVTGWKSNGKENACLQSWATFINAGTDEFVCIMPMTKNGHMYQSLKETGVCVINFPSHDIFHHCIKTIGNNQFDVDEITTSGLTAEKATKVDAPRIKECFLNMECEFLWEHELIEGSDSLMVAVKAVNICMDSDHYDQSKLGRYGENGFLLQVDQPTNPETGEVSHIGIITCKPENPIPWITK